MSNNRRNRRDPGAPVRESPVRQFERKLKQENPDIPEVFSNPIDNYRDSIKNLHEALDPFKRIYHAVTDLSVSEALKKFKKGDHIATIRSIYSHHGIYDGQGGVYEYDDGEVSYTSLEEFADGDDLYRVEEDTVYTPGQIIYRAKSRIGETDYNLLYNNCQNFATWCRLGAPIKTKRKR